MRLYLPGELDTYLDKYHEMTDDELEAFEDKVSGMTEDEKIKVLLED